MDGAGGKITKSEARERGYAARRAMTAHEQAIVDAAIFKLCQEAVDWSAMKQVHVYLPLARKREIGTWALVRWLWAMHPEIEVWVPRLTNSGMEHVAVSHDTNFRPNHYQIPEPIAGRTLGAGERLDVVIAPLLAFDGQGHRVGYGGGYYDRFLVEHPEALRVGLAYSGCMVEPGIVAEPHDIPLQLVVTEAGVITVGA
jgi:5-formyltetrahydrofolate cyclo-ligase